jgi:hypothetical protein
MSDPEKNATLLGGYIKCLRCKGRLESTGISPDRLECSECGQNYLVVIQMVPVEKRSRNLLPENTIAE